MSTEMPSRELKKINVLDDSWLSGEYEAGKPYGRKRSFEDWKAENRDVIAIIEAAPQSLTEKEFREIE